jgi:hypothetical protein
MMDIVVINAPRSVTAVIARTEFIAENSSNCCDLRENDQPVISAATVACWYTRNPP